MKIRPYSTVGNIALGATEAAVVGVFGPPKERSIDQLSRLELRYPGSVVRLLGGEVVEVSTDSGIVEFENIAVPFEQLSAFLRRNDASTFAAVGFIVSPTYGVAFDPKFPHWVTAFAHAELSKWKKHAA